MVLSLTTVRREGAIARSSPTARPSRPRRQSRPGGHEPLRHGPWLQHEPAGAPAAIASAAEKIRAKARLLAGAALEKSPDALEWSSGAWVGDGGDPNQVKTLEAIALYAHGTGVLPAGVEGGLDAQTVYRD
jgi:hypothetical protein